jgi:hypothetical protein
MRASHGAEGAIRHHAHTPYQEAPALVNEGYLRKVEQPAGQLAESAEFLRSRRSADAAIELSLPGGLQPENAYARSGRMAYSWRHV